MIDVSKFLKLLGNELDNVQISEEKLNNILKQCVVKEVNLDNNINNITKDVNAIVENQKNTKKGIKASKKNKSVFADWKVIDILNYCKANGFDKGRKIDNLKKEALIKLADMQGNYEIKVEDEKSINLLTSVMRSQNADVKNETKDVHPSEPIVNSETIKTQETKEEYKQGTFATIGNSSEHEHIFDKDGNEIIDRIDNTNNRLNNFVYDIDGKPLINQNVDKVETTKSEDIPSAAELIARAGLNKDSKLNNMPKVKPADQLNNAEFINRLESIANEFKNSNIDKYDDEYQQQLRNEERLRESYEVNKQAIKEHKAEVRAVRKLKVKNVFATGKNLTNHVIDKLKVGGYKVKEAGYNLGQRFVAAYNGFTQSSYDRSTINTALIDNNLASDYNDIDGMGGRRL